MDVSDSDIGHSDSEPASSSVFDNKTHSDELDLNRIDTEGEVKDKILTDTSKRLTLDINPNEAYSEDTDVIINNEGKQSDSRQDTHIRTTVKSIPQSSLYMGHPYDPTGLIQPATPQYNQTLSVRHTCRSVKLTPLRREHRMYNCCPAERKIRKRFFLIFFIVYVACVTTMVVFIMFGWFSGSFRRKVASLLKNMDSVNSTSEIQHNITRNSTTDTFIE